MKLQQEILPLVDFGADVAENDTGLRNYFVETADFATILDGKVDVIRAHKGVGKSAIYRSLLSGAYTPRSTIIVSASDAASSDIFRATHATVHTEDQFRLLWSAYLGSVIANETIARISESHENKHHLKEIRDFLKTLGLNKERTTGGLLDAIRRAKSVGMGLGVSPEGFPTLNFTIELDKQKDAILVSEENFLRLIDLCVSVLRVTNQKMWVLIDRLDELFPKGSPNEILCLRALFRSHLNICAIRQGQIEVRNKIFIRTDIYERITREKGFTNVTHFRDLNIVWNARSIVALVSRRVTANSEIRQKLAASKINVNDPNEIWDILSPQHIQSQPSHMWIAKATMDSSGAFNPRNYITLLSLSTKKNIELLRTNPSGVPKDTVLSADSIISSFGDLSRKRLDDTVLAEFAEARPYVERLRGGVASFDSKEAMASALGIPIVETEALETAIDILVEAGVLRRVTFSSYAIAYLYRPALKAGNKVRSAKAGIDE